MKHDITPGPQGANPIFEALFEGMRSHGLMPITPAPLFEVAEIPSDRSDATRDTLATGV